MQQPGLTIADLQSDAASPLLEWSGRAVYKHHVNIDSVVSDIDADKLARQIASKCGATEEYAYGRGRQHTGTGKEVTLYNMMPLLQAFPEEKQKALGRMRESRYTRMLLRFED